MEKVVDRLDRLLRQETNSQSRPCCELIFALYVILSRKYRRVIRQHTQISSISGEPSAYTKIICESLLIWNLQSAEWGHPVNISLKRTLA